MKFFAKLERKFAKYAIHNLMYYIIMLYVVGFVLQIAAPEFYLNYLCLDPQAIFRGELWRLVTFIIYPPTTNLIFIIFVLLLYYSLGNALERVWGAFRFNVYIFMGLIGHIAASLIVYKLLGYRIVLTTTFLNASVFFAYAATFPDEWFYLYFIVAIKAKWMALFEAGMFAVMFFTGNWAVKLEILLSLANFIIFFLMTRNYRRVSPKEIKRKRDFQTQVRPQSRARHKCAVCGRTDEDSPNMEFRYCSKCEGNYEYCMDHLYTHQHVKKDGPEPQQEKQSDNV